MIILRLLHFTLGVRGPITVLNWLMLKLRDMHWNLNCIHSVQVDPSTYSLSRGPGAIVLYTSCGLGLYL